MAASRVLQEEFARLEWVRVDSSNVEEVAYVPDFGRLWVRFLPRPLKRGGVSPTRVYAYPDVTPAEWEGLLAAPSKGAYLHARIKGSHGYIPPSSDRRD